MILSYILAISLLIMSVIKVADIFLSSDQELSVKQGRFIQQTRELHRNEKGSITLIGILFTLILSSLLLFFVLKMKVELKEARYRKDSYLCFFYLNNQTKKYVEAMASFNLVLRALSIAIASGSGGPQAKMLFSATKNLRNGRHVYYVKELLANNYCKSKTESLSYLKNLPFLTSTPLALNTNVDGTTKIRKPQWTTTLFKSPVGIRLKKAFCLKAHYRILGNFKPDLKIETVEHSMADFSKLKCLSGFP